MIHGAKRRTVGGEVRREWTTRRNQQQELVVLFLWKRMKNLVALNEISASDPGIDLQFDSNNLFR